MSLPSEIVHTPNNTTPIVAIVMGSASDWPTMQHAHEILKTFDIPHICKVVSAHRTPLLMNTFAAQAEDNGLQVIIAGAGGAAHLPGMIAAQTTVPVLGVPVKSRALSGQDSLLSIVQMPGGIPVGTLAIGDSGAKNAALLAVQILANHSPALRESLKTWRKTQSENVLQAPLD